MNSEKKYTEEGYLIVNECDACPLWEKDSIPSGFVMALKGCWYCKWADFRKNAKEYRHESVCRNEYNKKQFHDFIRWIFK